MLQQPSALHPIFGSHLIGRKLELEVASVDGYLIQGRIVEVTLEGKILSIKTEDTHKRRWPQPNFELIDTNTFSHPLEDVEVESDGTVTLIPWGVYSIVHIDP